MKKSILLFCMILSVSIYAQEKSLVPNETAERSFVAFSVGGIFPVGNFGNTSLGFYGFSPGADFPGFAKIGYHVELEGTKMLTANFGISGMIGYGFNAFDKEAFESSDNYIYSLYNSDPNINYQHNGTYDNYHHLFMMVGPSVGFRLDKLSLDARFLFGVINSSFFNYTTNDVTTTYNATDPNTNATYTNIETDKRVGTAPASTALALSLGASLRYSMTAHLAMLFKTELIWGTLKYDSKYTETTTSNDPYYTNSNYNYNYYYMGFIQPTTNINMPFTMFNMGIGLAYEF